MAKSLTLKPLFYAVALPALGYFCLFLMRPLWINPYCGTLPSACTIASINAFDQLAFTYRSVFADFTSNLVQNGAGVFAFLLPWVYFGAQKQSVFLNLILLSLTASNGVILEIVRALVQRPRPLVIAAPLVDGGNIHQYTSFYSGHTSFVAIATLFTLLWVRHFFPSEKRAVWALTLLFPVLTLLTGVLRVVGGRHYPTDVVGGICFGSAIALLGSSYFLKRI